MERIEVTRYQIKSQIEKDQAMANAIKSSPFTKYEEIGFYAERVEQLRNILREGSGIFSQFKNKQVEVIIK